MTRPALARYAGYRFSAEIIGHAVWLYFRFPRWARKFAQQFANQIRRRLPRVGDKWHLDGVSRTRF
jgi:putative transposase